MGIPALSTMVGSLKLFHRVLLGLLPKAFSNHLLLVEVNNNNNQLDKHGVNNNNSK